jgi:hypothetical protein
MSDLEKRMVLVRKIDQNLSILKGGGERLFNQDGDALLQEFRGNAGMVAGRNGNHSSIAEGKKGAEIAKGTTTETPGNALNLLGADIGNANELSFGKSGQDAGVLFAQMAHADHGNP